MNHGNRFLTFIPYALFFLVLFLSTDIVLAIPQKEMYRLKRTDFSQYEKLIKTFDAHVDTFNEKQDILFTVEFTGYAFIPTTQESTNKAIKLVFLSEKNVYETDTKVLERFELRDLFKKKEILGRNHGFITRFSPLKMKNGIYNLFIYCYENEETVGVFDTKLRYEKTLRSFSRYDEAAASSKQ